MLLSEFVTYVKKSKKFKGFSEKCLTPEHWTIINFVYTWHPCFSVYNVDEHNDPKGKIALLYQNFGISLIADMYNTALQAKKDADKRREINTQITEIQDEANKKISDLKKTRSKIGAWVDTIRNPTEVEDLILKRS